MSDPAHHKAPCKECKRPLFVTVKRQSPICVECHNRVLALEQFETLTDPVERVAVRKYADQMHDEAIAKGGRFDGQPATVKGVREPAYLPPETIVKENKRRVRVVRLKARKRKPKPKPEPAESRGPGRPPRPGGRMVMVGLRVPPETQAKLAILGRDWLILAVAKAGEAKTRESEAA